MAGYHTRWVRPEATLEDPERIAIREALAFGKALYDRRTALGLSVAQPAERTGMTEGPPPPGRRAPAAAGDDPHRVDIDRP
ncbi:MAG: hypothetical protein IRY84_15175 [Thermobispora bispora]|nr:hypothetical protein [Thermobispora bispora]